MALPFLPPIAKKRILGKVDFYFDPKDMYGPSFHFAHELEKGFLNYEQNEKNELLKLLPQDGVFYDIGANIGLYSVFIALNKPNAKLFCFEPNNNAYQCLEKTTSSMPTGNFKLIKKALGSETTEKKLYRSSINDGGHTFNIQEHNERKDKDKNDFEIVQITTIDELFLNNEILPPNIIKIDVEGFELEVLKGAIKTLEKTRPTLLIECSNKDLASKGELWQFLKKLEGFGLTARGPSGTLQISFTELSQMAEKKLARNKLLSNYFFQFEN